MSIDAQAALAAANSALQTVAAAVAEQSVTLSKLSLERDALSAANITLQAQLDTANATIASLTDPWREVDKTGATDVTEAFRAAVEKVPKVPAGRYLMDAQRPITLPTGFKLEMDPETVLVVKPNAAPKYTVLHAAGDDVSIKGGQIEGDRDAHQYVDTGDRYRTHEHGYGLKITGNRVRVEGLHVRNCTGDGIAVSGDDAEVAFCSANRNRRNGISVFQAARPNIHDCECSENGFLTDTTGLIGPFAGIDVEPDSGDASGVKLHRIKAVKNQKVGIALWVRDKVQSNLQAEIADCEIAGSPNCIWGADEAVRAPTIAATVRGCKLTFGAGAAVKAGRGSVFNVDGNTIDSATGSLATAERYGLQARDGGVVVKGTNRYV